MLLVGKSVQLKQKYCNCLNSLETVYTYLVRSKKLFFKEAQNMTIFFVTKNPKTTAWEKKRVCVCVCERENKESSYVCMLSERKRILVLPINEFRKCICYAHTHVLSVRALSRSEDGKDDLDGREVEGKKGIKTSWQLTALTDPVAVIAPLLHVVKRK